MKFKCIVEYEYPIEHKPPVKAEIFLHGDKVVTDKIIQLPKVHGDLIDRSKLLVELECGIRSGNYEEGYEKYPHINDMDDCYDTVKYADTVIKADRGE